MKRRWRFFSCERASGDQIRKSEKRSQGEDPERGKRLEASDFLNERVGRVLGGELGGDYSRRWSGWMRYFLLKDSSLAAT